MLRDQGVEPSASQRTDLGWVASNTWEIYLCLLSAQLEAYVAMRSSFPSADLDDFLQVHAPLLSRLKTLRDKFLHPSKNERYDDLLRDWAQAASRYYGSHLVLGKHLQLLLDQHLERLKEHLVDSLTDDMERLPENAFHALVARQVSQLSNDLRETKDPRERDNIQRLLDRYKPPPDLDMSQAKTPLDMRQKKLVRRLSGLSDLLAARPVPNMDYMSPSPEATQTPIHDKLLSSFLKIPSDFGTTGHFLGGRLPTVLRSSRRDYATLLYRALLLFNESYQAAAARLDSAFPSMAYAEIGETPDWYRRLMPTSWEEHLDVERGNSPGLVALALLADPLRTYAKTVADKPGLRLPILDHLTDETRLRKLSNWRNTVFHVADSRVQSIERIEMEHLAVSTPEDYRDLFTGLAKFYFRGHSSTDDS